MAWVLLKSVGDDSEYIYSYIPGSEGHPYRIAVELVRKIKAAFTDRDAAQADLAAATAERARYGDLMTARLGDCENERDAARVLVVALTEETVTWREQRDAARAEAAELRVLSSEVHRYRDTVLRLEVCQDQRDAARSEAAELQAERDEIIETLDMYGWWMDNADMLERLKFALAVCQEKSDDLSTIRMNQQGSST